MLDVPVHIGRPKHRAAKEVGPFLVESEDSQTAGGDLNALEVRIAIAVLIQGEQRLTIDIRDPAIESDRQAGGEARQAYVVSIHGEDFFVRGSAEGEHQ